MMKNVIMSNVKTVSQSAKFKNYIITNTKIFSKNGLIIDKNNVIEFYNSLSTEEKEKLTTYDLNILYYLLNNSHNSYVSKKKMILFLLESYISMQSLGEALKV